MSCFPNSYTILCTSTIYRLISGLHSLQLPLFQDFILDVTSPDLSYFVIFPVSFAASSFVIIQSTTDGSIRFWSVNMNENQVLTASYETFNVIPGLLMNYRSKTFLKYKNKSFEYGFSVPFIDQLVDTKKLIQNLFNETLKTYILYDTIVLHMVRVENDPYFRFVYVGLLEDSAGGLLVGEETDFDFANGTLVALIHKKPFMMYNRFGIHSLNLYPFTNYVVTPSGLSQNFMVIGGLNNYFLEPDPSGPHLWKTNFMYELQYQTTFFPSDSSWGYQPLADQIPVPSTCVFAPPYTGPTFIMAFTNQYFPDAVILGSTQFFNTENTILTHRRPVRYTTNASEYRWTVYPADGPPVPSPCPTDPPAYLYYVLLEKEMVIYECTFPAFLEKYKGFISIEDLKYSIERNQMYIQNRMEEWCPYGRTERNDMYRHGDIGEPLLSGMAPFHKTFFLKCLIEKET